jgi:hypothetical protein
MIKEVASASAFLCQREHRFLKATSSASPEVELLKH